MKNWFKKSTVLMVTISMVFTPLFLLSNKKAEAGVDFKALSGPVLGAAISCNMNKITGALSGKLKNSLVNISVPTSDEASEKTATKLNCLNAMAVAAAQVLIKEITAETLNWINGGFKQSPLFVKEPKSFFKSIRDQEIGSFIADISLNSPYGPSFAKAYIQSLRTKFADNSAYTMNKYFSETNGAKKFENDFTVGGWDAWMALTQIPQNNPLGYQLMATEEISRKTSGLTITPSEQLKTELDWGQGYLSPKVCVDPPGGVNDKERVNAQRELDSLIRGNNARGDIDLMGPQEEVVDPLSQEESVSVGNAMAELKQTIADNTCKRTEISTPGTAIASLTNTVLGSPLRQLEGPLALDLNNSLSAIFDALLNQLFTQGIDYLGSKTGGDNIETYDGGNGGIGSNNNYQSVYDDPALYLKENTQGGWGVSGGGFFDNFDITKDLDDTKDSKGNIIKDGLITMQKNYVNNIKEQKNLLQQIIPAIYQLDLCIPGPHPGWDTDGQKTIDNLIDKYPNTYDEFMGFSADLTTSLSIMVDWVINFAQGSEDPLGIGQLLGITNSEEENYAIASRKVFATTIGLQAKANEKINSKSKVSNIYEIIWKKYKPYMDKYNVSKNPNLALFGEIIPWNNSEYKNIEGYKEIMISIDDAIETSSVTQARLNILKNKVADIEKMPDKEKEIIVGLDCADKKHPENKDTYQCKLEAYKRTFNTISPNIIGEEQYQLSLDGIDSYKETFDQILGTGKYLEECKEITNPTIHPEYTGPTERRKYPTNLLPNPYTGVIYQKDNSFTPGLFYTDTTDTGTQSCGLPAWAVKPTMQISPALVDVTQNHVSDGGQCQTGPWDGLEDFLGIY